ncbi:Pachytene checkpoint protein 2 [Dispira simplex]|nr:Pachytene checkpoint protein 2 [Dispira simplex]
MSSSPTHITPVSVECEKNPLSVLAHSDVVQCALDYLGRFPSLPLQQALIVDDPNVYQDIRRLYCSTTGTASKVKSVSRDQAQMSVTVYHNQTGDGTDELDDENQTVLYRFLELPHQNLDDLWTNLVYEDDIPQRMLQYIFTTLRFARHQVNTTIVGNNKCLLFHGPPGTGKTTLCRALAQKVAIAYQDPRSIGKVVGEQPCHSWNRPVYLCEINSHSLFSKWFSESGKLVAQAFTRIRALCDVGIVIILIDEIESLTAARANAMHGNEPSDAMRVVNTVLTELDKFRECPNVLILATSNITGAIDPALVDRVDIKQYIGLPSQRAVCHILYSCLVELHRSELLMCTTAELQSLETEPSDTTETTPLHLWQETIDHCKGLSGRTLRKLPLLAYALSPNIHSPPDLITFLQHLKEAVQHEQTSRTQIDTYHPPSHFQGQR